jgi:hypothetical protein
LTFVSLFFFVVESVYANINIFYRVKGGEYMCCGTASHHRAGHWGYHHIGFCGCGMPTHCGPRFATKEQEIARLEKYLETLRQEVKAVEEHIAGMQEEK